MYVILTYLLIKIAHYNAELSRKGETYVNGHAGDDDNNNIITVQSR